MECQICFESVSDIYKVTCGSTVDHLICFDCEANWREKMPVRGGKRKLTCPTCRQEETERTMESVERELASLYVSKQAPVSMEERLLTAYQTIISLEPVSRAYMANRLLATTLPPRVPPPRKLLCASGRDCHTRSRVNTRSKTHLKCRACQTVACCASCRVCTGCAPLAPSS